MLKKYFIYSRNSIIFLYISIVILIHFIFAWIYIIGYNIGRIMLCGRPSISEAADQLSVTEKDLNDIFERMKDKLF